MLRISSLVLLFVVSFSSQILYSPLTNDNHLFHYIFRHKFFAAPLNHDRDHLLLLHAHGHRLRPPQHASLHQKVIIPYLIQVFTCKLRFFELEEKLGENYQDHICAYANSTGAIWCLSVFMQFLLRFIASRVIHGCTEIGKKAWLFAKLQPGRARRRINAT